MAKLDDKFLEPPFRPESQEWLASLSKDGKSARTIDCYTRDLRCLATELESELGARPVANDLTKVVQATVDVIGQRWKESGVCVQTVLRRFAAMRGFARFLCVNYCLDCGRLLAATLPPVERSPKRAIEESALDALLAPPPFAGWIQLRTSALFAVQASTGLTTSEVVALDRDQAPGRLGAISVQNTHLCPRLASASPTAIALMDRYLADVPFQLLGRDPLFINSRGRRLSVRSVQLAFRKHAAGLGLPVRVGPMSLRHWKGRSLTAEGHPPASVAEAMGISVAAAERYFRAEK